MKKLLVACVALGASVVLTANAAPVKIIFDTDMIGDYDDVGAMAVLHKLADAGECEILATVSSTHSNASVGTIEVLNRYYGRPEIPVGAVKNDGVGGGSESPAYRSHRKYEDLLLKYPGWWRFRNANESPDATAVYRRVLAAADEKSVTIATVGALTNLRKLLESAPDALSPLDGTALVKAKVKTLYVMGGIIPSGRECNLVYDPKSSAAVFKNWPTPLVINDFRFGTYVYAGRKVAALTDARNPVRDIFKLCLKPAEKSRPAAEIIPTRRFDGDAKEGHNCFDQTCVLGAVRGAGSFYRLERGRMEMVGENGENRWTPDPNGPHAAMAFVPEWPRQRIAATIDDLMAAPPARPAKRVPRPWTPVAVKGGDISVWGRTYSFASNALPVGVTALGRDLLAGPMRVVCDDADGRSVAWKRAGNWVEQQDDESATVCAWQEAETLAVDVTSRIEFDGMAKVSLAVVPGPKHHTGSVGKAWLEIPLKPERAKLYVVSPASWTKLDNVGGVKGPLAWPFRCSVWLGDETAGLCWFCESDEGLPQTGNVVEIVPGAKETVLRVRLIETKAELPRSFVFGLQATPVKPWNARRNADHTLHSPRMGVGFGVTRPEVWWTAQRAFPNGHIEEALDRAKAAGVKTVAFHEDWIPIQNNPSPRADFKAIVEACHARGIRAITYQGFELSPLDPLWGEMQNDCLAKNEKGKPVSYWFRAPGQRTYRVCYASAFGETWLKRAKAAYEKLGLDGFYLDGTIMPRACANARHGCGWRDEKGACHVTYPFFAVRKMMRELYEFVEARGGTIDAHQSGYVCPATLAFAHSYWDGEQLAGTNRDIKRTLNLEAFRAEFMGINHGVPCEFLAYEIAGKWSYEDALALSLVHNVLVRPCAFGSEARLAPLWKRLDDFGVTEAEWQPYWQNPVRATPDSVKVSVYRRGEKRLAVVSNLSPDEAVTAELELPGGKKSLRLEPFRFELVEF